MKKIIIIIMVIVIAVIAGLVAWFMFFEHKGEDTYYELSYRTEFDDAVSELTGAGLEIETKSIANISKVITYSINNYSGIKGANATVMYMFMDDKLESTTVKFTTDEYPEADEEGISKFKEMFFDNLKDNYTLSIEGGDVGNVYSKDGKTVSYVDLGSGTFEVFYKDVQYWKDNYKDYIEEEHITFDE